MISFFGKIILLSKYDEIKQSIKAIVDMPERKTNFLIHCIIQSNGILSKRKCETWFLMLTNQEIKRSVGKIKLN